MKTFFGKRLCFFATCIVTYLVFTAMSYGQTVVSIEPTKIISPQAGEHLSITLNITGAEDVVGYELTIEFDPTALSYIESAIADYLPVGAYAVPAITTDSSVYIAATSLKGPALASDGTLATVTFEVLTTNTSTIRLMDVTLANSAGLPLEVVTIAV